MHRSKEELEEMTTRRLVDYVLGLKEEASAAKQELDTAVAELQMRAERITTDRNIKFVEFSGSTGKGLCTVTTAQSLDILNLPKLKELVGEELVKQKVSFELIEKQHVDAKFKEALIAIFLGEYNTEYTVEQVVKEIVTTYGLDASAEQLLLKKLKGDYKKDKKTLMDVLKLSEEDFNLDEELYYIYQIKKYELIKAYLNENQLSGMLDEIRKYIVVEETVKVEVKPLPVDVA